MEKKIVALIGFAAGACVAAASPMHVATAQSNQRCHYTYFVDNGEPNIGESGDIEYDEDWKGVLESGYHLKLVTGAVYIFELCR